MLPRSSLVSSEPKGALQEPVGGGPSCDGLQRRKRANARGSHLHRHRRCCCWCRSECYAGGYSVYPKSHDTIVGMMMVMVMVMGKREDAREQYEYECEDECEDG